MPLSVDDLDHYLLVFCPIGADFALRERYELKRIGSTLKLVARNANFRVRCGSSLCEFSHPEVTTATFVDAPAYDTAAVFGPLQGRLVHARIGRADGDGANISDRLKQIRKPLDLNCITKMVRKKGPPDQEIIRT